MNERVRIFFTVFSLLCLCASPCFAIADEGGPKIGDVPPPLALTKTLRGSPAKELSWDKLKGKVVVLEFWATWCGPCVQSIPHVNMLAEQFKDKPVIFISVTTENEDVVQNFLKTHPLNTQVGLDDYEVLKQAFHVQGIPHMVIVDANGHIAAITHPAAVQPEHLNEILAGKKSSLPEPETYTINKESLDTVPNEIPPIYELSVREHKMPAAIRGPICMWSKDTNGFDGKIATVESALKAVFGKSASRMMIQCKLPEGYYDFKLRAPSGHADELQDEFIGVLRTVFHLNAKRLTKEMPVYILTQVSTNAPGLRRVEKPGGGGQMRGGFRSSGTTIGGVVSDLEAALNEPVFDETGLTGFFYVNMKWKLSDAEQADPNGQPDPEAVLAAARERLGLQLTPAQRPIEILEVSAAP